MAKSSEEKLRELREKQAQLKAQENAIVRRSREAERKARTRRLIQNGALAEQYLHCDNWEPSELEKLLKILGNDSNFQHYLRDIKEAVKADIHQSETKTVPDPVNQ